MLNHVIDCGKKINIVCYHYQIFNIFKYEYWYLPHISCRGLTPLNIICIPEISYFQVSTMKERRLFSVSMQTFKAPHYPATKTETGVWS